MTAQPARVTPGEISALIEQARSLGPLGQASQADQLAYFEHKADLLTRAAEDLGTAEAREVAANARAYAAALRAGPGIGRPGVAS